MASDRPSETARDADFSPRRLTRAADAHPLTVLVVDDEQLIREVTSRVLERAGMAVLSAATGDEACETLRRHNRAIDLVFLDMHLAGECGSTVLTALRRIDPNVRVVLVSGSSGELLTEMHSQNCQAFIRKPFDGPTLQRAIEQALM